MDLISRVLNAIVNVHPIHAMTVHYPIALTATALLLLLIALWRKNESAEHAAFYTITLASLSTVVAAVTGLRDNIVRFDGAAPLVNAKIFLAISLLLLSGFTAWSRWRQHEVAWRPSVMVMYVAAFAGCFALASVLGFLGGVILYGI